MKKSIPLKEIVGFLPYGLQMIFQSKGGRIVTVNGIKNLDHGIAVLNNSYSFWLHSSGFKPIVRPLSGLTKEITHNGETFVPAKKYDLIQDSEGNFCDRLYADQCESPFVYIPITNRNEWLFELKFDVYDWIKDGLAVDINTI